MKKFSLSFKLAVISQIISLIGGNILRFVLVLVILELNGTSEAVGTATAISAIPNIIFSIPGGVIADRLNKKWCIVALDACKTLLSLGLITIFLNGSYSQFVLTTFITLFAILVTLFGPILTSSIPGIVHEDNLVEANGIVQGINAISLLSGPVLGGLLYSILNPVTIVLISGSTFLLSTIIDLFIKIPFQKTAVKSHVVHDMKEGFHYMAKENPVILKTAITYAVLAGLYIPIFAVALPTIIRLQFDLSEDLIGIAQGFAALGMLIGGLSSVKVKKWLKVQHFSKWILLLSILCLILALSVYIPVFTETILVSFWMFNVGILMIMTIVAFGDILVMSNVQEKAPSHLLGKTIALVLLIASCAIPVGSYIYGRALDALAEQTFILFIIIALITLMMSVLTRKIFKNAS